VKTLDALSNITSLNLSQNPQIDDQVILKAVQKYPQLVSLNINGLDELTHETLLKLSAFKNLETLDVSWVRYFRLI
jgi:hypothetical protein